MTVKEMHFKGDACKGKSIGEWGDKEIIEFSYQTEGKCLTEIFKGYHIREEYWRTSNTS